VSFARYVRHSGLSRAEFDFSDLAFCRVGFLWFHDKDLGADSLALRTVIEQGGLGEFGFSFFGWFTSNALVEGAKKGG
jgi:hypothetical protein